MVVSACFVERERAISSVAASSMRLFLPPTSVLQRLPLAGVAKSFSVGGGVAALLAPSAASAADAAAEALPDDTFIVGFAAVSHPHSVANEGPRSPT